MIELMKISDLDQVVEIENKAFAHPWSRQHFIQEIENSEIRQIFVDREEGEVIAYGDIWYMFENCDLTKIAVKEEYRHKGYGYKMLKHLLRTAQDKDCEFMHLEVNVNNAEAIKLYKDNKFEKTIQFRETQMIEKFEMGGKSIRIFTSIRCTCM